MDAMVLVSEERAQVTDGAASGFRHPSRRVAAGAAGVL